MNKFESSQPWHKLFVHGHSELPMAARDSDALVHTIGAIAGSGLVLCLFEAIKHQTLPESRDVVVPYSHHSRCHACGHHNERLLHRALDRREEAFTSRLAAIGRAVPAALRKQFGPNVGL